MSCRQSADETSDDMRPIDGMDSLVIFPSRLDFNKPDHTLALLRIVSTWSSLVWMSTTMTIPGAATCVGVQRQHPWRADLLVSAIQDALLLVRKEQSRARSSRARRLPCPAP